MTNTKKQAIETHKKIIKFFEDKFNEHSKAGNPFKDRKWILNAIKSEKKEMQRI